MLLSLTRNRVLYQAKRNFATINHSQLKGWLKEQEQKWQTDITLVDVRERHEIEKHGKIKSALNVPFSLESKLFLAGLSDIAKSSKIVFQCMSGRRSDEAAKMADQLGFDHVYSLQGGLNAWDGPVQPFMNNHSPWVHAIFEPETETAQYVVTDLETKEAVIIDPVLNYDPFTSSVFPLTAKAMAQFVEQYELNVTKIIDTHVHADHLTAAVYLKEELDSKPEYWIGQGVTQVQHVFGRTYNLTQQELKPTGEQFDRLVADGMTWTLGKNIHCTAMATPGHTPACMSYRLGDAAFVGDSLFMPDLGTARCDFPGGSAEQMYSSVQKMYQHWPTDTRIYVGHDYPPSDRNYQVMTTLEKHQKFNKMINTNISLDQFISIRQKRDAQLRPPRFIHPSIQTNLRGGLLPTPEVSVHHEKKATSYFKIPVQFKRYK
ncbi:beta-lactamase-like protein [Choanephora cucurbitarum]|nr:beta-lactamase-like protein [Choanephora cucurbitarum]